MSGGLAQLLVCCLGYYLAAGLAITFGYHRLLTHRSFELPRALEYFTICLGLPAGTPIQWAGNHRQHHAHADRPGDPHSPLLDGFWYAHTGWYLQTHNRLICALYALAGPLRMLFDGWHRPRSNQEFCHLARDVAEDPVYRFLSRPLPYFVACALHALLPAAGAYALWGWVGVAAFWATLALIYNLGDAVDSAAHLWGAQPYAGGRGARNNLWLGLLTMGEGWHANHHAFPASARHGLLPGQFDGTYAAIRLLQALGVARKVLLPREEQVQRLLAGAPAVAAPRAPAPRTAAPRTAAPRTAAPGERASREG